MPAATTPPGRVSLARALSKLGAVSRAEATRMIAAGRVQVDGEVARNAAWRVEPERAAIAIDGVAVVRAEKVSLVLHKPEGVVTTRSDPQGRHTVYDLLPGGTPWVSPVGRLDRDSSGLLLLTSDTRLAAAVTSPASKVEKVYRVRLDRPLDAAAAAVLERGIVLDGTPTRPCRVTPVAGGDRRDVEVTLVEGRNRQVRRMLAAVGREVARLVRVRIGPVGLGDLAVGAVRPLTPAEVASLGGSVTKNAGDAPAGRPRSSARREPRRGRRR